MNLLQTLKAAKALLATTSEVTSLTDLKPKHICRAIERVPGHSPSAKAFIQDNLALSAIEYNIEINRDLFTSDLATKVLGYSDHYNPAFKQKARHLWLDRLILKLEIGSPEAIASALEGANPFLKTEALESHLTSCVCYAVQDYLQNTYKGYCTKLIKELEDSCRTFIENELISLHEGHNPVYFEHTTASKILGIEVHIDDRKTIQKARHMWLDQMIQKLRSKGE